MADEFGHEKLRVYQKAIGFVALCEDYLQALPSGVSVADHLARASESIPQNIAEGNGRRSSKERLRSFDVAYGSSLECAGALAICRTRDFITGEQAGKGKQMLSEIVRMLVGLRCSQTPMVQENRTEYRVDPETPYFSHETLDVYQTSLGFIRWSHDFVANHQLAARHAAQIDKTSTSIVLNIAEGNGRFSVLEHTRFLDLAHRAALRAASCLEVVVAKGATAPGEITDGKGLLRRIVSMLVVMKGGHGYSEGSTE